MASYLDQFLNKPRNPQASGDIFSGLYNPQQIADLESQYTNEYGIQNTTGGIASNARHMAAMNNLSNTIAGPINNISPSLGTFIGDTGAFLAGGLNEIGALSRGFNKENLGEIGEDIVANFKGSFGTPNSATAEDIYSQVFSGAVPQRVASGTPMGYGAAQAAEIAQPQNLGFRSMVDMNNDAQNFDSQFSYPNRGPVATNIATAPQPKGMSYEQMVDLGLAGPDQDVGMTAGDLQNRQGILQGLQDKMGGLKDFLPFGDKSLSGMAVKGIKGIGSGLRSLVSKLGDGANYQQYDPNVDYSDFNPNMEINDFYDPRTKTNRFQRAKPGSFASFRTGADYFKARREKKAAAKIIADQKTAAKEQQAIESIRQQYASQGRDYGQGAASQATQDSYQDSQGSYAGASTQDYGGGE